MKMPPASIDTEQAIVSAILLDVECLDRVVEIVRPEHFLDPQSREVYQGAIELHSHGGAVDLRTLTAKVGFTPRVGETNLSYVESYAKIVRDKWMSRQLIVIAQRASDKAYAGEDPTEVVNQLASEVVDLADYRAEGDIVTLAEPLQEAIRDMVRASQGGGTLGTPWGLTELDRVTGGLHPGELTVVAARPGVGKSLLAHNRAAEIASTGLATVNFSLEMPKKQVAMRVLAEAAKVEIDKIKRGAVSMLEMASIRDAALKVAARPFWIDDRPGLTLVDVRARIRKVQRHCISKGLKLGLVTIDYLQLMRGTGLENNREQEISAISRGLKGIAKEFSVPVLALSQLNREVEKRPDKRPNLADLRESGAIEADSDNIIFIYRDDYYVKGKNEGLAELIIAKQRNGPIGSVMIGYDKEFGRFRDKD